MAQLAVHNDIISKIIEPGSRVLDLGCGDADLLAWLADNKNVDARGVELDAQKVQRAISRGVSAYQGDLEECLHDYPDAAFDYVILSQTLLEVRQPLKVLKQMLRVGKRIIVAFPNFGHWSVRLAHLFTGRAPKNKLFPHDWYDSPNIHFLTVHDFEMMAAKEGWIMEQSIYLAGSEPLKMFPNFFAETAVFLIRR